MVQPAFALTLQPLKMPVMTPDGPVQLPPGVTDSHASLGVIHAGGSRTEVAHVWVTQTLVATLESPGCAYVLGELGAEVLVEFEVVRVPREHLGHRYGLRLVAEVLARLSVGRTCHAVILAEPSGWQSLKQRDRAPALMALDRHWRRLGFEGGAVRPDVPGRQMSMTVRDYQVPGVALAT